MKSNKGCPSYDCGFCETFPTPSSVKCGGEETKNCKWLNFDFTKTTYKEYMRGTKENENIKH